MKSNRAVTGTQFCSGKGTAGHRTTFTLERGKQRSSSVPGREKPVLKGRRTQSPTFVLQAFDRWAFYTFLDISIVQKFVVGRKAAVPELICQKRGRVTHNVRLRER